jgi:hypothetical protein
MTLFADEEEPSASVNGLKLNLTDAALQYLSSVGLPNEGEPLFYHALAVLHAPDYAEENSGALRQDWPRIPLPDTPDALLHSAALGRRVAALLDTETALAGVTSGAVRPELRTLGVVSRVGGGNLAEDDLALTVGWGHAGKGGVTMPAKGRSIPRDYTPEELVAFQEGAEALGLTVEAVTACLGSSTRDVYLNDLAYWKNVPERVWSYTIGGYQVIKKWLSYREKPLLGRPLAREEAREVGQMVRRIAGLLLLEPELNANYHRVKSATYPWLQTTSL